MSTGLSLSIGLGLGALRRAINAITTWLFTNPTLPAPFSNTRRPGLGTLIDASGNVVYGPHNQTLFSDEQENAYWEKGALVSAASNPLAIDGTRSTTVTYAAGTNTVFTRTTFSVVVGVRYFMALRVHDSSTCRYISVRAGQRGGPATFPVYSLDTGTWGTQTLSNGDSAIQKSATPLGNGWTLLVVSMVCGTAGTSYMSFGAANASLAANGSNETIANPSSCTLVVQRLVSGLGAGPSAVDMSQLLTTTTAQYLTRQTYDPVTLQPLGVLLEGPATNLYPLTDIPTTRTVTVTNVAHTLSVYGTCTITLSGTGSGTLTATGAANVRTSLTFTPTAGSLIMTVSGLTTGNKVQLESGTVPTSYIPNPTTGTMQRLADNCVITGAAFTNMIDPTQGTIVGEFDWNPGPAVGSVFSISDGSINNAILLRAGDAQAQIVRGGTIIWNPAVSPFLTGLNKVALTYSVLGARISLNGGAVVLLNSDCSVPLMNQIKLGGYPGSDLHSVNNTVRSFRSFQGVFTSTAAQLQALSAL